MKIIILEDEIPAKDKLVSYIRKEIDDAEIIGWGRSIEEGKALINEHQNIDLIFSDIELLDGTSFEIYDAVKTNCPIIFCTAFDQYLFKAFQTNGIAYLLKPYSIDNFTEAIEKYSSLFKEKKHSTFGTDVLSELKSLVNVDQTNYKTRFTIKKKEGIKLLNIDDIVSFEANGDFCLAYDNTKKKQIVNMTIGDIESKINPSKFFRINRSEIINVDYISHIEPHFKNRLIIKLLHKTDAVQTSSAKTPDFRNWLDQ